MKTKKLYRQCLKAYQDLLKGQAGPQPDDFEAVIVIRRKGVEQTRLQVSLHSFRHEHCIDTHTGNYQHNFQFVTNNAS